MFAAAVQVGRIFLLILVLGSLLPVINSPVVLPSPSPKGGGGHVASSNATGSLDQRSVPDSYRIGRGPTPNQGNLTYAFKTVFEEDLLNITFHSEHIQGIYVVKGLGFWLILIRINFTFGLPDSQKVDLQASVREQLQAKWYTSAVDQNSILCIPEDCHIPWPGYVIGELIVGFIPVTMSATNLTPSGVTLTWTNTTSIGIREYLVFNSDDFLGTLVRLPGNASSFRVTGLSPNTTYRFQVHATAVNGDYGECRALVVTTSSN